MRREYHKDAEQFVEKVLSGEKIVPKTIIQCCEKWKYCKEKYEYKPIEIDVVCGFIETLCRPDDKYEQIKLMDWQIFLLSWIYGFYKENGKRVIRELLLVVPRKAGKSTLVAATCIYEMVTDRGKNKKPEFILAAVSEKTAGLTYEKVTDIVLNSPDFCERFKITKPRKNGLTVGYTNGVIRVLSLKARNRDGYGASGVIADEISQLADSKDINVLRSGLINRKNPLLIMTTTPDQNKPYSAFEIEYQRGKKWLECDNGKQEEGFATIIYEAEFDDRPEDENVWFKVNPSIEQMTETYDGYVYEWQRAKTSIDDELNFRTRNLCQNIKTSSDWITEKEWDNTDTPKEKPRINMANKWFIGIDLADYKDTASICILGHNTKENKTKVWWETFYPRNSMPENDNKANITGDMIEFEKSGWLTVNEGDLIDSKVIAKRLNDLNKELNPIYITTDTYPALSDVVSSLNGDTKDKLNIVPKNSLTQTPPIHSLQSLVLNKEIEIEKNPLAKQHLKNGILERKENNTMIFRKPDKNSQFKIDCIDALLCALSGYLQTTDYNPKNNFIENETDKGSLSPFDDSIWLN